MDIVTNNEILNVLGDMFNDYKQKKAESFSAKFNTKLINVKNIMEADEEPAKKDTDEHLKEMLSILEDTSKLLHDKFQELKSNEESIQSVNADSNGLEYNQIQAESLNDSMTSIRTTILNLMKLYSFFTQYITKFGFKDVNAKQEQN
jgi:hypothetical protein